MDKGNDRSGRWVPYIIAALGPVIVSVLRVAIRPWTGERAGSFLMFGIPVVAAALTGGLWPGLLASAIGMLLVAYLFLPPAGTVLINPEDMVSVVSTFLTWVFVSFMCDLAIRQRAAEARARHQRDQIAEELADVLERLTDAFFMVDGQGAVRSSNPAGAGLCGKALPDMVGRPLWELLCQGEAPEIRRATMASLASGTPIVTDVREGTQWFHLRFFPDKTGKMLAVFVQDVTAKHDLDAARERLLATERSARAAAEVESRSKDDFVAVLSHELRTPLTSIIGWVEVLKAQFHGDEELSDGLGSIERSARHQARLIEDLLDISRIVTGQMTFHWEFIDLGEITGEVVREHLPLSQETGRKLIWEGCNDEVLMRGDALRLSQIVANLVGNALKFTNPNGTVEIRLRRDGEQAVLEVIDDGQGIDSQVLGSIFDRFRQAAAIRARGRGGLGLGLAIVRQLVEAHGGTVTAESGGVGKGALFTVRLPLLNRHQMVSFPPPNLQPVNLSGMRVLIVEDDELTGKMLERALSSQNVVTQLCPTAEEGLGALETFFPDVLVSDIGLPDFDGNEFIRRVRSSENTAYSGLPAVAVSAYASPESRSEALSSGFTDYLSKPIQIERLYAAIAAARSPQNEVAGPESEPGQTK